MNDADRRALYRLCYPLAERPTLLLGHDEYAVTELSEGGLRFLRNRDAHITLPEQVFGTIRFRDATSVHIEGAPLREVGDEIVIRIFRGVTLSRMMCEQRYLLTKYPGLWSP